MTRRYFVITATPAPGSSETLDELRSTLKINGLPTDVMPSYIPGGYSFESMDTDTDGVRDIFRCHFTDGEEHLLLIYTVNVDGSPAAVLTLRPSRNVSGSSSVYGATFASS